MSEYTAAKTAVHTMMRQKGGIMQRGKRIPALLKEQLVPAAADSRHKGEEPSPACLCGGLGQKLSCEQCFVALVMVMQSIKGRSLF